jgi:hypothetical protein
MPIDALPVTRRAADVAVGDVLPSLVIPLTVTKIVSTAVATRDYALVHHDQATARERGLKDVIVNILTSNGLVGRLVTDWAGPDAVLKKVAIRLGVSAYPGDDLTLTGTVTGVEGGTVTIAVTGAVSRGDHVTGTVVVDLPN